MPDGIRIGDPWKEAPRVNQEWKSLTDIERQSRIEALLTDYNAQVVRTTSDGMVTIELGESLDAANVGMKLRDIEREIRRFIDPGIELFMQPRPDRNQKRKFRGVELLG